MVGIIKKTKAMVKRWCMIRENKRLCKWFPFLIPWNRFSGKLITECNDGGYWPGSPDEAPEYDWSYTELDNMPTGWRKAFGMQMCVELREALIEDNDLNRWRIVQMKEKFGELRLYDNGHKKGSHVPFIIDKYAVISRRTCILCGKPATRITMGWISPYCDDCCPEGRSVTVEEYFKTEEKSNG